MRRNFSRGFPIFIWLMCLAFSARAQNAIPNVNTTFLANREPNTSSSIFYGDVWGETDLACLGIWKGYNTANGIWIYDISNPANPIQQSIYTVTTNSSHNQFEQGIIRNRIAYFGSWNGGGIHIVSLTNAAAPLRLSHLGSAGNGFDRVHTLFVERNFLYEAAHVNGENRVKVIDISNPFAPVFIRDITCTNASKVHQITAVKKGANTILYTSDFGNGGSSPGETDIWDVSNVGTQPAVWLGRIISGPSSHSSWPTPDGNTLVVAQEFFGGDVRLYDISNPAAPVLQTVISTASMGLPAATPHNPVVISNLLYFSWYQNGVHIFDITDRTKPVRLGLFDTFTNAWAESFQGNWGIFPHLGLNKILLSDIQNGFSIIDASAVLTGTNNYPPLLVASPSNIVTNSGSEVTIAAVVTGSSVKYQWRFNNSILPGATNSSIVYDPVQSAHSGNYYVIATNANGSVTSSVASLTVSAPPGSLPTITGQPENTSVYANTPAAFTVAVTGFAPMSFQWRLNGVDLPGATTNSLTFSNAQPEQVGSYSLFVSNAYGTATSSNATLTIIDSPYLNSIQATPGGISALISWKSVFPSDSQVQFEIAGIAADGAAQGASFANSSYIDRTIATNHEVLLTGLTPATRYSFQVISSTETNSYLSGVYQFTTAGAPIILDNTNSEVTFVGNWNTSVNVSGYYGINYRYSSANANGASNATFRPNIPVPGKYNVSVQYPSAGDRSVNAPFAVSYNGGSNTFLVNQQINGGQFNLIGSALPFSAGNTGFVRLANNASASVVIADAVRFDYVGAQETPLDNTVPAWWSEYYFGSSSINPLADPDGDGYTTSEEYLLGTSPTNANKHLELEVQASGGFANITFWPYIGNRTYQLLYKTNIDDPTWQTLSPGPITPTPYGHGIFSLSTGAVANGFYRLAVTPVAQGDFSGKIPVPRGDESESFVEAACGYNRIFVRPRRY